MLKKQSFLMGVCLAALALMLTACSGLAGEPQVVATVAPPTPEAVVYPPQPPNLSNGAKLFAENCTACHGAAGDGQGAMVTSGEVPAMPSFLDSTHVSAKRPDEYFSFITNGNLEKLMPPWKDALTVQERWDVAMYVYTLHYDRSQFATGAKIYADECAGCHGDNGTGDGVDMIGTGRTASDMSDHAQMLTLSDNALLANVREGVGEVMPAYQDTLSEAEIQAVVAYSRGFSVTSALLPDAESTDEPLPENITFSGTLSNGTAGSSVPAGLTVYLRYGAAGTEPQTLQTTLQPDNTFSFNDVPVIKEAAYLLLTVYQEQLFTSDAFFADDLSAVTDASIVIYEVSDDPKNVVIRRIQMDIEPHEVPEVGAGLIFAQRIIYENTSDRLYILPREVSGANASVVVQLPPGAIIISTDDPQRYVISEANNLLVDTLPVLPGEHIIQVIYFLPYQNGAIIDLPQTHAIQGDMTLNIAPTTLEIKDARLVLQPNTANNPYSTYTGSIDVPFGETLRFEIAGIAVTAPVLSNQNPAVVTSDNLLPVILIGVIVLTGIFGLILMFTRRRAARSGQPSDKEIRLFIRQIAELDEMHSAGQINHDVYQRQRQELKAQLARLMAAQKSSETGSKESASS